MTTTDMGIVVIGRNEGERLKRCLLSLESANVPIVYVDSGSTDQSVMRARKQGAVVVELNPTEPFTAAKARNAGLRRLLELAPVKLVQFVDGDCEVIAGWLDQAIEVFSKENDVAVICGRCCERFRNASIYNRLCDLEWDAPTGEVRACGGNAMMRVAAFLEVGGYRQTLIAGEEPELCVRLRERQWRVLRLGTDMVLHDAAMYRFRQWWQRSVRAGHAAAEAAWLHGRSQPHIRRRVASVLFWAMLLPLTALLLSWATRGISLGLFFLAYALLVLRIYMSQRRRKRTSSDSLLYACFVAMGKFAELCGMLRFAFSKLLRRHAKIIEYKQPDQSPAALN